jgi:hypothetical protein
MTTQVTAGNQIDGNGDPRERELTPALGRTVNA